MGEMKFNHESDVEPIKIKGKITKIKRADGSIHVYEKELFIVTYQYRELYAEKYDNDTIVIKAYNNLDVHKYMDKFRQAFIACGYDMQYSFQKVGEGNFVEV